MEDSDQALIQDILNEPWLCDTLEQQALGYAAEKLVPEHYQEIQKQRERQVKKTLDAVHERLTREIDYWQDRYFHLKDAMEAGKQPRMQPENARRRAEELRARLEQRTKHDHGDRHLKFLSFRSCADKPAGRKMKFLSAISAIRIRMK